MQAELTLLARPQILLARTKGGQFVLRKSFSALIRRTTSFDRQAAVQAHIINLSRTTYADRTNFTRITRNPNIALPSAYRPSSHPPNGAVRDPTHSRSAIAETPGVSNAE